MIAAAIVLLSAIVGMADEIPSYSVTIAPPRYSIVGAPERLGIVCGPYVQGCTQIKGSTFSAECEWRGDSWRMAASVSLVPYVYLRSDSTVHRILRHELAHIDDVERSTETYLRRLASTHFESLQQCRDTAIAQRNAITAVIGEFARHSFEVRR